MSVTMDLSRPRSQHFVPADVWIKPYAATEVNAALRYPC